jgi:photosystem II stability/assembly factor-like uncharacterized protein
MAMVLVAALLSGSAVASAVSASVIREVGGAPLSDAWTWRNPLPTGNTMNAMCFTGVSNGWLAGARGTILRTTNAGSDWTLVTAGALGGKNLTAIRVTEGEGAPGIRGIVVGEEGAILYTKDGATWHEPSSLAFGVEVDFRDLFVAPGSPSHAWVVGQYRSGMGGAGPVMARTADGGANWTAVALPDDLDFATRVSGTSTTDLWVLSGGAEWAHWNGAGWTLRRGLRSEDPEQLVADVVMMGGGVGYALGSDSSYQMGSGDRIYRTVDGGSTWTTAGVEPDMYFARIEAIPGAAWARAYDGRMYRTLASGSTTWTPVSGPDPDLLYRPFQMLSTTAGFCMDDPGSWVRVTNDSAATFSPVRTPAFTTSRIRAVDFVTDRMGWAVGPVGTALHTADGGVSWQKQDLAPGRISEDVCFVDARRGWAVGDSFGGAHIARTTDGGVTWETLTAGRGGTAVCFVDATHGWTAGQNGRIHATTDGGGTWTTQTTGVFEALWGIDFTDVRTGWACGSGDTVLKTVDGGSTWTTVAVPPSGGTFDDVDFLDANRGWLVDSFGGITRTSDGGGTWQRFQTGARGLRSVRFLPDGKTGWATGYAFRDWLRSQPSMTVLTTRDGGETWTIPKSVGVPDPSVHGELWDVDATSSHDVWVVGDGGAILKAKAALARMVLTSSAGTVPAPQLGGIALKAALEECRIAPDGGDCEDTGGRPVEVQYSTDKGVTWRRDGVAVYDAAEGAFVALRTPSTNRRYRFRIAADDEFAESVSNSVNVLVKARITGPGFVSPQRVNRTFRVSGTIQPGHRAGTGTKVQFQRRLADGKTYRTWSTRTATHTYVSAGRGTYSLRVALPYRTRWRVRVVHEDADHARTVSAWRYLEVR